MWQLFPWANIHVKAQHSIYLAIHSNNDLFSFKFVKDKSVSVHKQAHHAYVHPNFKLCYQAPVEVEQNWSIEHLVVAILSRDEHVKGTKADDVLPIIRISSSFVHLQVLVRVSPYKLASFVIGLTCCT